MKVDFKDIDSYIAYQLKEIQSILKDLKAAIIEAAPQSEEVISYGMPAFKLYGMLVYFAGYKKHIGFYPTASGISAFKKELSIYKNAKGSVQFPLDKPLPLDLIKKIVKFRVKENSKKQKQKKQLK